MKLRRSIHVILSLLFVIATLLGNSSPGKAEPLKQALDPTDPTKIPHYFGPYPNWANSQFTLPQVSVAITGDGNGATAVATVGANGSITAITVTDPGQGYTYADVEITGAGSGAAATATVITSGVVTGITVDPDQPGSGYTAPVVTITGGGGSGATATAYGGVDKASFEASLVQGAGYKFPTVDFDMPDDPNGTQAKAHAEKDEVTGAITALILDEPGSGYATAPKVTIRDGTIFDPTADGGTGASATTSLFITTVVMNEFGADYSSAPAVSIDDPNGYTSQAVAVASVEAGGVTSVDIPLGSEGSGYITSGGIRKFTDQLPGLCDPSGTLGPVCPDSVANPGAKYIPVGVPDTSNPYQSAPVAESDTYVIGLVQYRTQFSSSLPATLVRGYVQLETTANEGFSQHYPLTNEMLDGTKVPVLKSDGSQWLAVTPPQWLGPTIIATKNRAVRIVFHNLLPTGAEGDLFIPVDATMMGSGEGEMMMGYDPRPVPGGTVTDEVRNPMCTTKYADPMMREHCFTENRATLHLHGGITPWISDGTPHQWITPPNEATQWPEGVSVQNVPDMDVCNANDDGCQTFYYTNQQSARLMFYHDHSWGITRLNVLVGEAAGYLITDDTEQKLIAPGGPLNSVGYGIPLVIQDRTFVPDDAQLALQDPTWDSTRWGTKGNFWYHHVYMPAQNPGDPGGMSAYGRWMYGAWFWPPQTDLKYGPIANPYYDPTCKLDDPGTWLYQTDPFCEPELIPGTPNISVGMEQFNDTPIVNGTAYPTITLDPKTYRFRVLNAANDRFWNLQWYVGDPRTASTYELEPGNPASAIGPTEVAFKQSELDAAQTDLNVFPTPDTLISRPGPSWIQIGSEGGFLPAPVVIPNQPTTWITDPTRFDVGNVDKHSLLIAPAERADVVVDFSKFAGQTLILYNDAPAAFPARVPSYDYYTGYPDQSPNGPSMILPGFGPNTRTIMQVKIANAPAAPAYNLTALQNAFKHHADGSGVFESGQHPIIVGQAAYNSAYGTSFSGSSYCNGAGSEVTRCDGYARISDQGYQQFGFNTLRSPNTRFTLQIEPKAIHDEMNSVTFDEFGRMTANLGITTVPATPGLTNANLMPYVFPPTELIDGTNLPTADVKVTPIGTQDGAQIWKFTHNGVDTHPIHFHLYDVQVLNRVTWDNIILPPDANELGWKDTVRISPLEDTIVALRPIIPKVPFDVPNSIRLLSPMMPEWNGTGVPQIGDLGVLGSASVAGALGIGIPPSNGAGEPIDVVNHFINFGWEYVYHCHILSHEEMDMMRPVLLALPPVAPTTLEATAPTGAANNKTVTLSWTDNSRSETDWDVQRSASPDGPWQSVATVPTDVQLQPTTGMSTNRSVTYDAPVGDGLTQYYFKVRAINLVGDTWDYANPNVNQIVQGGFPTVAAYSDFSNVVTFETPPAAPSNLQASLQFGPQIVLTWQDNATNEQNFVLERSEGLLGGFVQIATPAANAGTGSVTYTDTAVQANRIYSYRVAAANAVVGNSSWSNVATVVVGSTPTPPNNLSLRLLAGNQIRLTFRDNSLNETGFAIERSTNNGAFVLIETAPAHLLIGNTTYVDLTSTAGNFYRYRVAAVNGVGRSAYTNTASISTGGAPAAPANLQVILTPQAAAAQAPASVTADFNQAVLTWTDNADNEEGFLIEWSSNPTFWTVDGSETVGEDVETFTVYNLSPNTTYYFRLHSTSAVGESEWLSTVAWLNVVNEWQYLPLLWK